MSRLLDFDNIGYGVVKPTNIDELCLEARRAGVTNVIVSEDEMLTIARYVAAVSGQSNWGAGAVRTGTVDMLYGVRFTQDVQRDNSNA